MWLKFSPLGSGTSALTAISSTLHVSSKWGPRHLHSDLVGKGDILLLSSPSSHKRGFPAHYIGTQTLTVYKGSPRSTLTGSSWRGAQQGDTEPKGVGSSHKGTWSFKVQCLPVHTRFGSSQVPVLCFLFFSDGVVLSKIQVMLHKALKYQIEKSMLARDAA